MLRVHPPPEETNVADSKMPPQMQLAALCTWLATAQVHLLKSSMSLCTSPAFLALLWCEPGHYWECLEKFGVETAPWITCPCPAQMWGDLLKAKPCMLNERSEQCLFFLFYLFILFPFFDRTVKIGSLKSGVVSSHRDQITLSQACKCLSGSFNFLSDGVWKCHYSWRLELQQLVE